MSSFHDTGSIAHYSDETEAYAYPTVDRRTFTCVDSAILPLVYSEHEANFGYAPSEDRIWAFPPTINDTTQPWADCLQSAPYYPSEPVFSVPMDSHSLGNKDGSHFSPERVASWHFVEPSTLADIETDLETIQHAALRGFRVDQLCFSGELASNQKSTHASVSNHHNSAASSSSSTSDGGLHSHIVPANSLAAGQAYKLHYNPSLAGSTVGRRSVKRRISKLHSPSQWLPQGRDEEVLGIDILPSHQLHCEPSTAHQPFQYVQVSSPESRHGNEIYDCSVSTPSADSGYVSQSYASTVASMISPAMSTTPSANGSEASHQRRRGRKKKRAAPGEVCRDESTDTTATSSSYRSYDETHTRHVEEQYASELVLAITARSTVEASTSFEAQRPLELDSQDGGRIETSDYSGGHELEDQSNDMVDSVTDDYEGEKVADCNAGDHSEHHSDTDDGFDDNNVYMAAFKHFRLESAVEQAEQVDVQETPGRADGTNSRAGSSVPSTISSFMSSRSGLTSTTNLSGATSSSRASDRNGLKVAASTPIGASLKPLDLICWHAALGMRCKKQTGRSHEARRLYSDHSWSKKSPNNHRLSARCKRCGLLFPNDARAAEHDELLRSPHSCPILDQQEVSKQNAEFERDGITVETDAQIMKALKEFRGNKTRPSKLPDGCDLEHYRNWVGNNTRLYIGESSTSTIDATKELSHWYIYFCVLFPGASIPNNPFAESSEFKHRRLLEILKFSLVQAAGSHIMPQFTPQQDIIFSNLFNDATDQLEAEILEEKSRRGSLKSNKRRRSDELEYVPATPAPPVMTDAARQRLQASWLATTTLGPSTPMPPPASPFVCATPGVLPPTVLSQNIVAPSPTTGNLMVPNFEATTGFTMASDSMTEDNQHEEFMNWPMEGPTQPYQ